jgi:hypothetical protein
MQWEGLTQQQSWRTHDNAPPHHVKEFSSGGPHHLKIFLKWLVV